ncbi:hypothetical protein [Luteibacter sp. dw_328]|uniref:hypothetical protein n=1 Tax=Luteibacter sp. dw_328 TaxID=2719796 RepID=UPI001BD5A950|nr:hypothetical protein [Luteibacter sp. dw_328]
MKLIPNQKWVQSGLIGFLCLASSFVTNATCLDPKLTVAKEAARAALVVVGVAIESHDVPDPEDVDSSIYTIYVVKVTRVLKGRATKPIWLFSENTTSRYPMDIGKPNLLFISKGRGMDFVDNCGNSGPLDEQKREFEQVKALALKGQP